MVNCGEADVVNTYPELIQAAEGPVIDTSSAAVLLLAREVHQHGYKAALTGEGADEWLLGYPWFKVHKLLSYLDFIPGLSLSQLVRRGFLRLTGAPRFNWDYVRRSQQAVGGYNAWLDMYGLISMSKLRFFSPSMLKATADLFPYDDLGINHERLCRWHPLHRSVYLAGRVHLPGLLLSCKGDRVAMHSSLEARYPFLDEDVFAFLARLHPRWKLHGFRDKYILRLLAQLGCLLPLPGGARPCSVPPSIASMPIRRLPWWNNSLRRSLRKPAISTRRLCITGGSSSATWGPDRCNGFPSRWAWCASWQRSFGTICLSTAAWLIYRAGLPAHFTYR